MKINLLVLISIAACATAYAIDERSDLDPQSASTAVDQEQASSSSSSSSAAEVNEEQPESSSQSSADQGSCPKVWSDIASDLKSDFRGCTRSAADAIRFAFHDAAGYSSKNDPYAPASGGADGSLLLSSSEINRKIQDPLQGFHGYLLEKYNKYKSKDITAADFTQAAGNIGVVSCGGPVVKTVIGRTDTSKAAPEGTLPQAFGPGSDAESLLQLWADKGFNARELAALMGAHSVSRAFRQQANGIPSGSPQDTTPKEWDTKYYSQTQAKEAPRGAFRFDSDVNLARDNGTSQEAFTEFANDKASWSIAFQSAMFKLSILGLSGEGLQDCTSILG